jgi:signal transduction histidine kinase
LGAERRLDSVATLLSDARSEATPHVGQAIAAIENDLNEARRELREFAQGVHPAALTDGGLIAGVELLAERSPVPVEIRGTIDRLPPPVEAALFFVCSEALANVAKHAAASRATVDVTEADGQIAMVVIDDGRGGADLRLGSGLTGLSDRIEALGGRLAVESPPGAGTGVFVELPLES